MPDFQVNNHIRHAEYRKIEELKFRRNARRHDPKQLDLIAGSLKRFGWVTPVLVDEDHTVLAGYGRVEAARIVGIDTVPVIVASGWTDVEKRAYMLADNQIALRAGWDEELLKLELDDLRFLEFDIDLLGFEPMEIKNLSETGRLERPVGDLKEKFILPPFSVLDARSGWWQDRKRAWLALGIRSEIGRGDNALRYSDTILQPDPAKRAKMNKRPERGPKDRLQNATPGSEKLSHLNSDVQNATVRSEKLSHPNMQPSGKREIAAKYGEAL